MSNPTTPYGFKYDGLIEGLEPNFGVYSGNISVTNTASMYQGDPAIFTSGYFTVATATGGTGAPVVGVFIDFSWLSISAGMRVRNRAWLGQTADIVSGGTLDCKVAVGSNLVLQARVTGASANPIVQANVGEYVNFATGSAPGANLVSTFSIDATTLASSSTTLPFQVYRILQPPYSDPTSADNDILVTLANYKLL